MERDFSDKFNTDLSPEEEYTFRLWAEMMSKRMGRDILGDLYDYDVRGYWKSGAWKNQVAGGHGPDTWKKPNHPTFSDESVYSGQTDKELGPIVGGSWMNLPEGGPAYAPSREMLKKTHNIDDMRGYLMRYEPGVALVMPDGSVEKWETK